MKKNPTIDPTEVFIAFWLVLIASGFYAMSDCPGARLVAGLWK